jgi:uncharacterized protein YjeT (DUF2065 family)
MFTLEESTLLGRMLRVVGWALVCAIGAGVVYWLWRWLS